jgi:hypothetical protein
MSVSARTQSISVNVENKDQSDAKKQKDVKKQKDDKKYNYRKFVDCIVEITLSGFPSDFMKLFTSTTIDNNNNDNDNYNDIDNDNDNDKSTTTKPMTITSRLIEKMKNLINTLVTIPIKSIYNILRDISNVVERNSNMFSNFEEDYVENFYFDILNSDDYFDGNVDGNVDRNVDINTDVNVNLNYLKRIKSITISSSSDDKKLFDSELFKFVCNRFFNNLLRLTIICLLMHNVKPFDLNILTNQETWGMPSLEVFFTNSDSLISTLQDQYTNHISSKDAIAKKIMEYYSNILMTNQDVINDETNNFLMPENIRDSIVKFITSESLITNTLTVISQMKQSIKKTKKIDLDDLNDLNDLDDLHYLINQNSDTRIDSKTISNNVIENVYCTLWDYILREWNKRPRHNFITKKAALNGIVTKINSQYQRSISMIMEKLDEFIVFKDVYDDTFYPPVFINSDVADSLNKLFQDAFVHKIKCRTFRKKLNKIIYDKIFYLSDMIISGIDLANKRGIDVVKNLYDHCKNTQNILKIHDTFLPMNCPTNPTSKYFLQVIDERLYRDYYRKVGSFRSSCKKKWYTSYVSNFHEYMMANIDLTNEEFAKSIKKYYYESVTKPINETVLDGYITSYHTFLKNN